MRNDYESNYLAHHGILGMKWGQRNGPPYPLTAKMHSAAEKAAGWRKSLADSYKAHKKKKAQKKALIKARKARAEKAKREAEQKQYEENKEKALKSGKASEVLKYQGDLTNKQLEDAFKRLEWEKKLGDFSAKEVKDGWAKMDEIMDKVDKTTDYVKSATNFYDALKKSMKSFGITKDDPKKTKEEELKEAINEVINSRDPKKIKRYQSLMTNDQLAAANRGLNTKKQIDEYLKTDKDREREAKKAEKEASRKEAKEAAENERAEAARKWAESVNMDYEYSDYYDDEPPKSSSKSTSETKKAPTSSPQFYNLNDEVDDFTDDEVRRIEEILRKKGYI